MAGHATISGAAAPAPRSRQGVLARPAFRLGRGYSCFPAWPLPMFVLARFMVVCRRVDATAVPIDGRLGDVGNRSSGSRAHGPERRSMHPRRTRIVRRLRASTQSARIGLALLEHGEISPCTGRISRIPEASSAKLPDQWPQGLGTRTAQQPSTSWTLAIAPSSRPAQPGSRSFSQDQSAGPSRGPRRATLAISRSRRSGAPRARSVPIAMKALATVVWLKRRWDANRPLAAVGVTPVTTIVRSVLVLRGCPVSAATSRRAARCPHDLDDPRGP
jgi:hypothetical protein